MTLNKPLVEMGDISVLQVQALVFSFISVGPVNPICEHILLELRSLDGYKEFRFIHDKKDTVCGYASFEVRQPLQLMRKIFASWSTFLINPSIVSEDVQHVFLCYHEAEDLQPGDTLYYLKGFEIVTRTLISQ